MSYREAHGLLADLEHFAEHRTHQDVPAVLRDAARDLTLDERNADQLLLGTPGVLFQPSPGGGPGQLDSGRAYRPDVAFLLQCRS